ncbi:hypothetical protein FIBSPDRAFT_488280 [Athelia psychrophila]|uniref:Secreted protein n=1 Tax=Athelia psychrophila TaxID=1759441 RepID=A0A166KRG4_9AGAM|nr:hypothetical protein FIBSPDRAFT_488280 [Fibularhizoctonia sp. CBS 109695]
MTSVLSTSSIAIIICRLLSLDTCATWASSTLKTVRTCLSLTVLRLWIPTWTPTYHAASSFMSTTASTNPSSLARRREMGEAH